MYVAVLATLLAVLFGRSYAESFLSGGNTDYAQALQFMNDVNEQSNEFCEKRAAAFSNYQEDKSEVTKQMKENIDKEWEDFQKETWKKATSFAWKDFKIEDGTLYRWFMMQSTVGDVALPSDKYREINDIINNMTTIFSAAKVCNQSRTCDTPTLAIIPDLTLMMSNSKDYDELEQIWTGWRDATGKPVRNTFLRFVQLQNEAAKLNGFPDQGAYWRSSYESETFRSDIDVIWEQIKPFYQQLHAYVRRRLMNRYPGKIRPDGPIPAHILGNMWAATWQPLSEVMQPFPKEAVSNVTHTMIQKGMTVREMFELSEEFFTSLGLDPMPPEFWKYTVMVKPEDEDAHCNAYAQDVCSGKNVRIVMCALVTMDDLYIIHHEMGHVEYFLQYGNQPIVFQQGANPAFHEAVGDAIALSVTTPAHLKQIGLIDTVSDNPSADINYMMLMALDKLTFLPFGYLMDLWRWGVFDGSITKENLNTKWWELKLKYQGICPPSKRTEEDLDAASLVHVVMGVPYVRYFVAFIIQFQIYKALCTEAGHRGPLHKCDIYGNKDAGRLLSEVLSKGSSISGSEAMLLLTRGATDKMDASAFMEYFEPLLKWLEEENRDEVLGWNSDDPTLCPND